MLSKPLALVIAAGASLLVAAPTFAQPPRWAPAHGWRAQQPQQQAHHPDRCHHQPNVVVVYPRHYTYVAPRPKVVLGQPAYVVYPPVVAAPAQWAVGLRIGGRF